MSRATRLSQEELIDAEAKYAGQIKLILVTGYRAIFTFRGRELEFELKLGVVMLLPHEIKLSDLLFRLMIHKAREAMQASFAGYKKEKENPAAPQKTKSYAGLKQGELFSPWYKN